MDLTIIILELFTRTSTPFKKVCLFMLAWQNTEFKYGNSLIWKVAQTRIYSLKGYA